MMIDPNGDNANPIYDKKTHEFLGTDSKGWEGEAILMDKKDFEQGMDHEKAKMKGTLYSNLSDYDQWMTRDDVYAHYTTVQDAISAIKRNDAFMKKEQKLYEESIKEIKYVIDVSGQVLTYSGYVVQVVGYGSLIFGGAGAPIIAVGNGMSLAGSTIQASIDFSEGRIAEGVTTIVFEGMGVGVGKLMKGSNPILREGIDLKIKLGQEITNKVIEEK